MAVGSSISGICRQLRGTGAGLFVVLMKQQFCQIRGHRLSQRRDARDRAHFVGWNERFNDRTCDSGMARCRQRDSSRNDSTRPAFSISPPLIAARINSASVPIWTSSRSLENSRFYLSSGKEAITSRLNARESYIFPMLTIVPDEMALFRTRLLQKGLSQKSARNVLTLLGKILTDAWKGHYLKTNPMVDVDRPKIEKKHKGRALKPDEINFILEACSERLRPIAMTAVLTGMRRGEELGPDWESVDFENDVIRVRRALFWKYGKYQKRAENEAPYVFIDRKSKESIRDIDMSPALKKELRRLYLKSGRKGLVFCMPDGSPLNPDNLTKGDFARALKKADVERAKANLPTIGKVRWHDLRHTFGSLKIDQGENVYYVMRQMGHSSIQVTIDSYVHQLKDRNPGAAAKTDAMIFGA